MCPRQGSSRYRMTVRAHGRVWGSGLKEDVLCKLNLPRIMVMSQGGGGRDLFLKRSRDIEYAKQRGHRISTALFNIVICRIDMNGSRVGIVVGKRFGGAVIRNRAKRLFRELTRQVQGQLVPGHALVVFPKRGSISQPFALVSEVWVATLQRQRLLCTDES